jgi:hypothetical protein
MTVGCPSEVTRQYISRNTGQHYENHEQKTPVPVGATPIGSAHIADFLFLIMRSIMFMMMLRQGVTSSLGLIL